MYIDSGLLVVIWSVSLSSTIVGKQLTANCVPTFVLESMFYTPGHNDTTSQVVGCSSGCVVSLWPPVYEVVAKWSATPY